MHCTFKAVRFPDWFSQNPKHPTKSLKCCNVSNIIHWHRVALASTVFHISYILGSVMHAVLAIIDINSSCLMLIPWRKNKQTNKQIHETICNIHFRCNQRNTTLNLHRVFDDNHFDLVVMGHGGSKMERKVKKVYTFLGLSLCLMSYSTTVCKFVDITPAIHQ